MGDGKNHTVYLPQWMWDKIEELAKKETRSRSKTIQVLLQKNFKNPSK